MCARLVSNSSRQKTSLRRTQRLHIIYKDSPSFSANPIRVDRLSSPYRRLALKANTISVELGSDLPLLTAVRRMRVEELKFPRLGMSQ